MKIGFSYNVKHTLPSKNLLAQKEADFDSPETIAEIKKALEAGGHEVWEIEANQAAYLKFYQLKEQLKIIFNIAEGLGGEIREAQIPAMLEMLQIPYTHSGALTHALSLDKTLTKIILLQAGIPTPRFQLFKKKAEPLSHSLSFPLLVKPNNEGSSIGIFCDSLVYDKTKLFQKIDWLLESFREPVLVEEYIDGREVTVSILGNNPPKVLPIVEQNFAIFPETLPRFASYEAKWIFEDNLPDASKAYFCPAPLEKRLQEKIEKISLKIFEILDCRDVCRIDFRIDKKGNPFFLEINPLPGLMPDPNVVSYLPIAARVAGFSFEALINTILNEACQRYGLPVAEKYFHFFQELPSHF